MRASSHWDEDFMKNKSMTRRRSSRSNGWRFPIRAVFLALLLVTLTPANSHLAVEQPHVGFGAYLSERSNADLVDEMGFDWVVWGLQWSLAEYPKGTYHWQGLDELLDAAETLGLKVVLRVDSAPSWARGADAGAPPNNMHDFGDFMDALVSHVVDTGREVAGYVIWNEPNLPMNWGGSPSAFEYVQMLKAVYPRIKDVDPDAAVITAGMATTGGPGGELCGLATGLASSSISAYTQELYASGVINDLDFICGIYRNGGKKYFDVLGSHPYGFAYEPQRNPSSVGGLAFRRVEQQRKLMEIRSDAEKQIWAIEFGWILDPGPDCHGRGDWPTRTWQIVTEQQQADYLMNAYLYARSRWPWMGVMSFFNMDFAAVYWYDYCEPARWYSIAYRENHEDPGNSPIVYRQAYYALRGMLLALEGGPKAYLPLVL